MTVSATEPIIRYNFTGPGNYAFTFRIFVDTDIKCYHIGALDGTVTQLQYVTDFTVDFDEDIDGGTVAITWTGATDGTLEIRRELPVTQENDWINNDPFDMETLEDSFDRIVMILQQMEVTVTEGTASTNWRGVWTESTLYFIKDVITAPNNNLYVCAVEHTSTSSFANDLANGYWKVAIDVTYIEELRDQCITYADNASDSADAAAASALAAEADRLLAETAKLQAQAAEASAAISAQNSANCNQEAYDNAGLSKQWAIGDPSEPAEGSSKYWAGEAQDIVDTLALPVPAPGDEEKAIIVESVDPLVWGLGAGGGGLKWENVAVDTTAESPKGYIVDTSGGAIAITLPLTAEVGDTVGVMDANGQFATNTCTIVRNGHTIMGLSQDMTLESNYKVVTLVYQGVTHGWRIESTTPCLGALDDAVINKNYLLNAEGQIDQRGAHNVTVTNNSFVADRWKAQFTLGGGVFRAKTQGSNSTNGSGHFGLHVTTARTSLASSDWVQPFQQILDGVDIYSLNGQTITVSFLIFATKPGIYNMGINCKNSSTLDLKAIVKEFTVFSASTWQYVEISVDIPDDAFRMDYNNSLTFKLCGLAGTDRQAAPDVWYTNPSPSAIASPNAVNWLDAVDNYIYIGRTKLEKGPSATEYVPLSRGEDLARCQRYFTKSYIVDTSPGTVTGNGATYWRNMEANGRSALYNCRAAFQTTMRDIPTVTFYNPTTGASGSIRNVTGNVDVVATSATISPRGIETVALGSTISAGYIVYFHYTADAEI